MRRLLDDLHDVTAGDVVRTLASLAVVVLAVLLLIAGAFALVAIAVGALFFVAE